MDRQDERDQDLVVEPDQDAADTEEHETHATTGGAAAAGAVTGGVIGLTGGPLGAAIGAVGGAIVGVAAERMMHGDDERDVDTTPETPTDSEVTQSNVERTERDPDSEMRI
jgi:outer membrane lipoprotein SlyB